MLEEAQAASACVSEMLANDGARYMELSEQLRRANPGTVLTVARGSSDHAANYIAYLIMKRLGRVVASLPMSLLTLYQAPLEANNALAIAVSQSGQSPDVVQPMRYFTSGGATTVALVNDANSPLAQAVQWAMPLRAGPERSVAATKSFIASLTAGARLVAHWQNDATLLGALQELPQSLACAAQSDWQAALDVLAPAQHIMVVGRGPGFSVALEAALKFKETSALQAEAFSGAEIKHGPMALIDDGYPLLIFALRGPAQESLRQLAQEMRGRGAKVLLAAPADVPERDLTLPVSGHADLDPIVAIETFYVMAAHLAVRRGLDPDKPRHLNKVTKTN